MDLVYDAVEFYGLLYLFMLIITITICGLCASHEFARRVTLPMCLYVRVEVNVVNCKNGTMACFVGAIVG